MSLILTDRWFEIPQIAQEHQVQTTLKNDLLTRKHRSYTIAAGRRSYKTERFCKRYAVTEALRNDKWEIYLGAPTRQQAKEILWEDVKNLVPPYQLKRKPYETELKIELINGTKIHIIGLQEFKRVHGGRANLAIITEYQDCDPAVYTESFQPMLNDTQGTWIAEGRPFGKNHFYDFYLKGLNNEEGWGSYHWKSSEILLPEQIRQAREDLALKDYQREYDASFETEFGAPYYSYSKLNNRVLELNPNLPVLIVCDFNATEEPMSWVIGQEQNIETKDITYFHKVLSHQFTNTETMSDICIDELRKTFGDNSNNLWLKFYGDYAGVKSTSNSSASDWEIIEKKFSNFARRVEKKIKPCLSIRNSVASTNGRLCNTNGERRMFVNYDECKPLVLDFEKCEWKSNNRELNDKDPLRGHACRAVDYFNDYEHPSTGKTRSKQW
jgi:hypothetical protein